MRTVGRTGRAGLVAIGAVLVLTTAACEDEASGSDKGSSAGCKDGVCHVALRGHQSLALGHDKAKVTHVGDDRISLSWHGLSFTIKEGLTIKIGKYTLRLKGVHDGSARVDVKK